jgi:hypothetical protein
MTVTALFGPFFLTGRDDCLGDAEDCCVGVSGAVAQVGERVVGADAASFHEDALGLLDYDAAPERAWMRLNSA